MQADCGRRLSNDSNIVVCTMTSNRPLTPTVAIMPRYSYSVSCARPGFYGWASECPDVKNYKWRLNPVWHRMLYSCAHMATVSVTRLTRAYYACVPECSWSSFVISGGLLVHNLANILLRSGNNNFDGMSAGRSICNGSWMIRVHRNSPTGRSK